MSTKKGICPNREICEKAQNKEIQERDLLDFVCEECGHELEEYHEPVKKKRPVALYAAIGVVAVVVIAVVIYLLCAPKSEVVYPETLVAETDSTEIVTSDTVAAVTETVADTVESTVDTTHVAVDTVAVVAPIEELPVVEEKKAPAPTHSAAPKSQVTTPSNHNLGYATWTGGMRNGNPHGNGTMTYTQSRTIDSRDSKNRVAQSGEYVIGEWDNGHLVQGRWFKRDGSKEVIIIGKAN